jgi:hypothetical protein
MRAADATLPEIAANEVLQLPQALVDVLVY